MPPVTSTARCNNGPLSDRNRPQALPVAHVVVKGTWQRFCNTLSQQIAAQPWARQRWRLGRRSQLARATPCLSESCCSASAEGDFTFGARGAITCRTTRTRFSARSAASGVRRSVSPRTAGSGGRIGAVTQWLTVSSSTTRQVAAFGTRLTASRARPTRPPCVGTWPRSQRHRRARNTRSTQGAWTTRSTRISH